MSIDYIARQIANVDRDINSIESIIHPIDANITRKQKEAHSLLDKIAREKDLKRMIGYQKDLTKKNEEINKLEKDKSSKSKSDHPPKNWTVN
ncbi:hypothetical protein [Leadbetterella byssophila]|uniref:hypothetical protein n=1 Tax=Leadbetterella byssophila TaxID=316068 RepID=UPI0039A1F4FE